MTGSLAFFVTPHGFGHAARSCAVMEAIHARDPDTRFEIFTGVPEWFFRDSLDTPFGYHPYPVDVGLVQRDPLTEDLPATLRRLDELLPVDADLVASLAKSVKALGCRRIVCDIAPLGIAVARQAEIPSILVENFTWDWIYRAYLDEEPGLARPIAMLAELFETVDCHIQTEPVCRISSRAALTVLPASRNPKTDPGTIRAALGIPPGAKVVLVTMGGIPADHPSLHGLNQFEQVWFIIPNNVASIQRRKNCILLPHHSQFYHPDLVRACDAVVGKSGYSTLAETYQAGVPFGYISRSRFPESGCLSAYIQGRMQGIEFSPPAFDRGDWLARLPELLSLPRVIRPDAENGADRIAQAILDL